MREVFLKAIADNRFDFLTRQAYADWLEENGFDDDAVYQRSWTQERQEAEDFLDYFASELSREGNDYYDEQKMDRAGVIAIAHEYLNTGDMHICMGFDTPPVAYHRLDEFWRHFKVLTGRGVDDKGEGFDDDWDAGDNRFVGCSC